MSNTNDGLIIKAIKDLVLLINETKAMILSLSERVDEQTAETRTELRLETESIKSRISDLGYELDEGFHSVEDNFHEAVKKINRLTEKILLKKVISEKEALEVLALGPSPYKV